MTEAVTRCPHCGASIGMVRPKRCAYCGNSLLVHPQDEQLALRGPGSFEALETHPDYSGWLAHEPEARKSVLPLVVGVLVALLIGFLAVRSAWSEDQAGAQQDVVPLLLPGLLLLVFLWLFGSRIRQALAYNRAPFVKVGAAVVSERVVPPQGHDADRPGGRPGGRRFLTLRLSSGEEADYRVRTVLPEDLERGDMGVAFLKNAELVEFRRVRDARAE